jgi:hypothetical protein
MIKELFITHPPLTPKRLDPWPSIAENFITGEIYAPCCGQIYGETDKRKRKIKWNFLISGIKLY